MWRHLGGWMAAGLMALGLATIDTGVAPAVATAQELGGAGTVQGTVKDPTDAVMVAATVTISNRVSGFRQSRIDSNQISPDAVQSMELITGVAPAEFGDKTSLIVRVVTRSGLDQTTPTGSVTASYGSFSTPSSDLNIGAGRLHILT
jgi:hypothetical protein